MGMTTLLAALVAALAFNEFVHVVFEVWGVRQKVAWLKARLDGETHKDWPVNINSLTKTIVLHSILFAFFVSLAFGLLLVLKVPTDTLLIISILLLVVTYSYTTLGMDAYHQEIGNVLKRYKRHS